MSTLIICLPPIESSAALGYDYALTRDERVVGEHANSPLALLPAVPRGTPLVAVLPAQALSWHAVDLPRGVGAGSPRLRAVLENLLEDRLLDDPGQLHLALGPTGGAGNGASTWVAACNRQWLGAHLQALEAAGRPVARIVPEFEPETGPEAGPDAAPMQVHVSGEPDQAFLVATGGAISGVMRVPLSAASLSLLPPAEADQPVLVTAEPSVAALAEQLLQSPVVIMTRQERWLDAARSSWDLAQFELSSSSRARTVKRLTGAGRDLLSAPSLRPARWGLAALVVANLVGLNTWALKEQSALDARRLAIGSTLTRTFAQVRVVVDAPLQMEREVAALRQATGASSGRDLEAILAAVGAVAPTARAASSIDYSAGEARIKGMQLTQPDAANVAAQLASFGYTTRFEGDTTLIRQDGARPAP